MVVNVGCLPTNLRGGRKPKIVSASASLLVRATRVRDKVSEDTPDVWPKTGTMTRPMMKSEQLFGKRRKPGDERPATTTKHPE